MAKIKLFGREFYDIGMMNPDMIKVVNNNKVDLLEQDFKVEKVSGSLRSEIENKTNTYSHIIKEGWCWIPLGLDERGNRVFRKIEFNDKEHCFHFWTDRGSSTDTWWCQFGVEVGNVPWYGDSHMTTWRTHINDAGVSFSTASSNEIRYNVHTNEMILSSNRQAPLTKFGGTRENNLGSTLPLGWIRYSGNTITHIIPIRHLLIQPVEGLISIHEVETKLSDGQVSYDQEFCNGLNLA